MRRRQLCLIRTKYAFVFCVRTGNNDKKVFEAEAEHNNHKWLEDPDMWNPYFLALAREQFLIMCLEKVLFSFFSYSQRDDAVMDR